MTTSVNPAVLLATTPLTNADVAYITAPTGGQTIIKRAVISSVAGGAITFTIWRVANGGSTSNADVVVNARSVASGGTDLLPELANMVLNPGDSIHALASAGTSLNMTASGFFIV